MQGMTGTEDGARVGASNIDLDAHARPNRFEIDLGAIAGLTRRIRAHVGPGITIFAALKCNAYGYGLIPVARTVLAAGADALSMVDPANAIALRQGGVRAPILVYPDRASERDGVLMGWTPPDGIGVPKWRC
jgi:alanine racemase